MNGADQREKAIVEAALKLSAKARPTYLDQTCGSDVQLRERIVAALYKAQEKAAGTPPPRAPPPRRETIVLSLPPEEKAGERIGRYQLVERLGEGGMGVVWRAEQIEPVRREVALKVIKSGLDTKEIIARFETERQALALMDHPNIAKVLDAGATETGRPYFVMDYVRGIPITDYCDRHTLDPRRRLELFIPVCQAIEHAHRNGIIHRDIKPLNILVTLPKGETVPVPKVIDFGIAKALWGQFLAKDIAHTSIGNRIGTLAYMAPEQAEITGLGVDERSDIYSLGVLLYELLTGQTPFDTARLQQASREGSLPQFIRKEAPPSPSTKLSTLDAKDQTTVAKCRQTEPRKLIRLLRGDLDWIVLKTLEKDPAQRYKTADALAMNVQRHLNDQPIETPRPTWLLYCSQKLLRRNRKLLAAASIAAGVTLLALFLAVVLFREPFSRALAVPPPKVLPEHVKALAASDVLDLAYSGAPPLPPARTPPPQLQFDIQAKRREAAEFSSLRDGDPLVSGMHHYLLVAHPLSRGYLYVFQVDAAGKTQWLFPANNASEFSSGANPVTPGQVLQMPAAGKKAFYLDATAGIEHVYAVFSATRWPDLEAALSKPSAPLVPAGSTIALVQEPNALQTRGIAGLDDITSAAGAPVSFSVERIQDGKTCKLYVEGRPLQASGAFLVLERWFRHVNSTESK
jgi:serine/threonine protein kinase